MATQNCINPTTNCCESCQSTLQGNCTCQTCSPITVQCTADINNAVCVPILADQIYDCINIEKEQCSYISGVTFTINPLVIGGTAVTYSSTEPVCITGVGVSYDYIGLVGGSSGGPTGQTSILIDGTTFNLTPSTVACTGTSGADGATAITNLYDQASTTISRNRCCCNNVSGAVASRARIIERGLIFYICNPSINIAGSIGCTPFTASASLQPAAAAGVLTNPVSTAVLGFDPMTFCSRLCLPLVAQTVTINENYTACLQAECVTWDGTAFVTTDGVQTMTADIEMLFTVTKQILATVQEQIAVFTTPDAVICRAGTTISPCPGTTGV